MHAHSEPIYTTKIKEGITELIVPNADKYVKAPGEYIPAKLPVFYNRIMELNRDISIGVIQALQREMNKELYICDLLAATGARGVRIVKEISGIFRVVINDMNPVAIELIKENVKFNQIETKVEVSQKDAAFLMLEHSKRGVRKFDYIDIDPFGTPVPFVDHAIFGLFHFGGMLGVTATDTAPLCGVYPKACFRKYGSIPLRTEYCHEIGVRILAGYLARTAAKLEVGLKIRLVHSTDHYFRVYAIVERGAQLAEKTIEQLGYIVHCFKCGYRELTSKLTQILPNRCPNCNEDLNFAGPLWVGQLFDKSFCEKVLSEITGRELGQKKKAIKIFCQILEEAEAPPTYYDLHKLCQELKISPPKLEIIIQKLKERGYKVTITHFKENCIRTNANSKELK
ncbi:MAG: tRNA (guanine(10)-N(2))-dimethyltransferase, partial [Euryarchaeota archaeon]|nr:tRNA (guanine(10)-N(2))-dimethyltransferase [Euryarchaeota archaeon]